ncbi:flavin reductase, partial [Rhizobium johnstonii]|uniref:flavin reductase n=1 Tax=Rhizobium johnstonii TaxID=3019933 RepID=UPI003F95F922
KLRIVHACRGGASTRRATSSPTSVTAIVAIGVENYADMRFKDTDRNIRETGEFTVHICDDELVDQMEVCAIKFGPEVDEISEAGLATAPG